MDNTFMDSLQVALEKAKHELSYANHLEECGANAGIRKMNANKADWLSKVVYLVELGLETEKYLSEPAVVVVDVPKTKFEKAMAFFKSINSN